MIGILRIEHVEGCGPVVGINDDLHAVAEVVDIVVSETVVGGVWILIGGGECVEHPREPAIFSDDDVRILLKREERSDAL